MREFPFIGLSDLPFSEIIFPKLAKIRQIFALPEVSDIPQEVAREFDRFSSLIKPGARIAITAGSRGVKGLPEVIFALIRLLRDRGADPFIVPAMGSHGGATAEGQKQVLEQMGITEERMGAPIRATMEVVELGRTSGGLKVFIDRFAYEADGIIAVNRIKPHTAFHGEIESGLMKILAIGLGKQRGAASLHSTGFDKLESNIVEAGRILLGRMPVLFGIGIVENARHRPAIIKAIGKDEFEPEEKRLLRRAKELMAQIYFPSFDVLVVQEIGKDISGDGMDPNVTGRYPTPFASGGPIVQKIVVLDLTDETQGNANGIGQADVISRRVVEKMDVLKGYVNAFTSTALSPVRIPMVMATDRDAVGVALHSCVRVEPGKQKVVWIKNTLDLERIWISEPMLPEAADKERFEILSPPTEIPFTVSGDAKLTW